MKVPNELIELEKIHKWGEIENCYLLTNLKENYGWSGNIIYLSPSVGFQNEIDDFKQDIKFID